jgi:hypothetical protein
MKHTLTVIAHAAVYIGILAVCVSVLVFTGLGIASLFRPARYVHPVMEYPNEQYILVDGVVPDTVYVIRWINRRGEVAGSSAYSGAERDGVLSFLREKR